MAVITTAYRSVLRLRKDGWRARGVEGRRGGRRFDHFGVTDVEAFAPQRGILWVQAYDYYARKAHDHLNADHPVIKDWLASGGKFCHHVWHRPRKKLPKWTLETRWIGAQKPDEVH